MPIVPKSCEEKSCLQYASDIHILELNSVVICDLPNTLSLVRDGSLLGLGWSSLDDSTSRRSRFNFETIYL